MPLSDLLVDCPRAVHHLFSWRGRRAAFSATAVCDGNEPIGIVYNDSHEPARQRADIAHEAAHILLRHKPSAVTDDGGRRAYPEREEAEAHWLGPTLLVPRSGMLRVLRETPSLEAVARHFDVSLQLARFRYNTTGCRQQVRLAAA